MNSRYINALVRRHTGIERQIEDAQKSPCPDALLISRLEKIRLQCRDQMKEAITQKRIPTNGDQRSRFSKASARLTQAYQPQPNGGA
jgi:hypothetical protein